jgi:uncharacterized protein (TIGR03083 family)
MTTTIEATSIQPIARSEAERLAAAEYRRLVEQLRSLEGDDWTQPTDCPLWDVRAMAGHCVGMMADFTSLRSVLRRLVRATLAARQAGGPLVDSMTAQQVAEQAELSPADLIARAAALGPKAARWRTHAPAGVRRMPVQESVGGVPETWRMGFLLDTILTRDPWMHRVDIARATGRDLVLTAEHDGRLVADVVGEWARRHGQPFTLTLTGPAGGAFTAGGTPGEQITIDAVEFCRIVSGRAPGEGLLAQPVPF